MGSVRTLESVKSCAEAASEAEICAGSGFVFSSATDETKSKNLRRTVRLLLRYRQAGRSSHTPRPPKSVDLARCVIGVAQRVENATSGAVLDLPVTISVAAFVVVMLAIAAGGRSTASTHSSRAGAGASSWDTAAGRRKRSRWPSLPGVHGLAARSCALLLILALPRVHLDEACLRPTTLLADGASELVPATPCSVQTGSDLVTPAVAKESQGSKGGSDGSVLDAPPFLSTARGLLLYPRLCLYRLEHRGRNDEGAIQAAEKTCNDARAPPSRELPWSEPARLT
jgi:hypothetical protein